MRILATLLLFACAVGSEPLITREEEEQLRREVTWEVETYENNIFKDWTLEDFHEAFPNEEMEEPITEDMVDNSEPDISGLPDHFDGRQKWGKCVHPIRRQGKCGSCWAFAVTGTMSDRFCLRGRDVILSPQHLVSCNTRNHGCRGGSIYVAMDFMTNYGIVPDACYPYISQHTKITPKCPGRCTGGGNWNHRFFCKKKSQTYIRQIAAMKQHIFNYGPIVTHQKYHRSFNYYKGGIYMCDNKPQVSGHFMKVIGWGRQRGIDYWLIANSFGTRWGEGGYVRFKMNVCGINEYMGACEPLIK